MTTTPTLFHAVTAAERCALARDFADASAWIASDLGAEMTPDMTIQFPVPDGLDHEGRLDWLTMVARSWKTSVRPDGHGGQLAEKRFGRLRFTASVAARYGTHTEYLEAMNAARAQREAAA